MTGGKACSGTGSTADGYFIEPTVFTGARDNMTIAREEIFGPVTALFSFASEEEVIERANNSEFGLSAALFTKDSSRVHRVARKLESGSKYHRLAPSLQRHRSADLFRLIAVWCNSSNNSDIKVPFGGFKQSGIGRECGKAGIDAYTQTKAVFVALD